MGATVGTLVDDPPSRGVGDALSERVGVDVGEGVPNPKMAVGVSSGLTGRSGMSAIR